MASETNVQPENFIRDKARIHHLGPSPVTLDRDNSDLQVVNTTTETALLEYTVQGGQLVGDRGLRVTLNAFAVNNSGGLQSGVVKVQLGATALWTSSSLLIVDGAAEAPFELRFELMAKNSDAIQELFGHITYGASEFYGEATEDATGDLVLAVTVDLSAADADFEFTRRRWIIELL